jgi:hypothetical protein
MRWWFAFCDRCAAGYLAGNFCRNVLSLMVGFDHTHFVAKTNYSRTNTDIALELMSSLLPLKAYPAAVIKRIATSKTTY